MEGENSEKNSESLFQGLIFEASFAIALSTLLINIVLIARIKYGEMQITHISTRPYLVSMFLLITLLAELTAYLILTNVVY